MLHAEVVEEGIERAARCQRVENQEQVEVRVLFDLKDEFSSKNRVLRSSLNI